ncbi:hypothetical protein FHS39_004945 [Streptomyces olivoverticillatus]|uniref:DUF5602 domain-containing protein n=1 Tax=Streptomyces olivoverticillatus TaxID=66427 RepID=A0A7W7PMY5_9ACTN|nr:hypothetical protein [Streptomyces olivoverticillatus]MBB4895864.1 hypothetical protein [Streptomyces olivoverticillatus]
MLKKSIVVRAVMSAVLFVSAVACAQAGAAPATHGAGDDDVIVENRLSLGNGYVQSVYSRGAHGAPRTIGITVDEAAMKSLPTTPTHDGNTCFDTDGNGSIDPATECKGGHERVLWFPKLEGLPFQWMMFNWQPMGHGPTHVFDKPHFDLHFFIQDYSARNAIRTGPCGALLVNCDDHKKAILPVPDPFSPPGFGMPGDAGRMGNHLADLNAPPVNGGPFTQAFVYGTYNAHISFWETVFNKEWLAPTKPKRDCIDLRQAPQVEQSGYYPRKSCVSYRQGPRDYLMTLEDFVYRSAPAGTPAPQWGATKGTGTAQPEDGHSHSAH